MKKWSEFLSLRERCWPGYKSVPGKKAYSPGSCMKESAAAAVAAAIAISKKKSGNYDKKGFRKTPYKNPDSPNRKSNTEREAELKEDLRKWFSKTAPEGGWKRINSKGEAIGPCAREPGEAKPKCMSNEKRASLTKKERASAVASKRKHDPNPERKGEPINVSNFGKGKISENMENLEEKNVPTSPEKWAQAKSQAKAKFDVYPSAYANGWAAKKYKEMGGGWKSVSEESEVVQEGRPSQRHPLEGHEYHKKSNEALIHIAKDAHKAAEAMKSHNTTAENKYRDQANDSATVRYFRQKNGMPEWYKKKYGHIKEAKEKTEYDYEGDMARGQLQSIVNNAQRVHDMLKDNDNLPEWVQSKITLAEDYISTVANYMMSEVDEEVELDEAADDIHSHRVGDEVVLKNKDYHGVIVKSKGSDISFKNKSDNKHYKATHNMIDRNISQENRYKEKSDARNKKIDDAMASDMKRIDKSGALKKFGIGVKEQVAEEVQPIEELSKDTLKSYMDKSSKDNLTSLMKPGMIAKKHAAKRFIGMVKAGEKLTKEANSANMPADIGTPAQLSLKPNPKKLETPVYEAKSDIPFEGPYSKAKDTVTDKSGAKHGPMSRVRSLARQAIQKQKVTQKKTVNESRRMEIVREAMADAKKKDAVKKKEQKVNPGGDDKFQSEPELTSSITKNAQ